MKNRRTKTTILIAAALLAGLSQASAYNITIPDLAPGSHGFGGGPTGQAGEDNETEPGTWSNQFWDLEAFAYKKDTGTLFLIGGYEFASGYGSGYAPGDLFIKVGGSKPTGNPLSNPLLGLEPNSTYGYTYAVSLSSGLPTAGTVGIQDLTVGNPDLKTVGLDYLGSNPWKVAEFSKTDDVVLQYHKGLTSGAVALLTGVSGLLGEESGYGSDPLAITKEGTPLGLLHNVVQIELGSYALGKNLWFSYTMQCGNDSIKGHIPDGGTTLVLLGTALSGLFVAGRRFRKA